MASDDVMGQWEAANASLPSSNPAEFDVRNDRLQLRFDASTDEFADFTGFMPENYGAGGLTATLCWSAGPSGATSGNVVWNLAFERLQDEVDNFDSDSIASVQAVTSAAPSTAGLIQYATISFTNGAQMDSVAAGEMFRMRLSRDADNASDTMTGDAYFAFVNLKET